MRSILIFLLVVGVALAANENYAGILECHGRTPSGCQENHYRIIRMDLRPHGKASISYSLVGTQLLDEPNFYSYDWLHIDPVHHYLYYSNESAPIRVYRTDTGARLKDIPLPAKSKILCMTINPLNGEMYALNSDPTTEDLAKNVLHFNPTTWQFDTAFELDPSMTVDETCYLDYVSGIFYYLEAVENVRDIDTYLHGVSLATGKEVSQCYEPKTLSEHVEFNPVDPNHGLVGLNDEQEGAVDQYVVSRVDVHSCKTTFMEKSPHGLWYNPNRHIVDPFNQVFVGEFEGWDDQRWNTTISMFSLVDGQFVSSQLVNARVIYAAPDPL